jgi:hypothetical protein
MFADFYGNEHAPVQSLELPGRVDRSNSISSSQTSLDEEQFFRNAPGSTNYFPRHSHDSYSELNSSGSSWN